MWDRPETPKRWRFRALIKFSSNGLILSKGGASSWPGCRVIGRTEGVSWALGQGGGAALSYMDTEATPYPYRPGKNEFSKQQHAVAPQIACTSFWRLRCLQHHHPWHPSLEACPIWHEQTCTQMVQVLPLRQIQLLWDWLKAINTQRNHTGCFSR